MWGRTRPSLQSPGLISSNNVLLNHNLGCECWYRLWGTSEEEVFVSQKWSRPMRQMVEPLITDLAICCCCCCCCPQWLFSMWLHLSNNKQLLPFSMRHTDTHRETERRQNHATYLRHCEAALCFGKAPFSPRTSECPSSVRSYISEGHRERLQLAQPFRIDNDMKTTRRLIVCEGSVTYKIQTFTCRNVVRFTPEY